MGPQQVQNLTDSLQGLLKDGADFADLAVEYSQDPGSAKNGGDLGWFAEGQMVPEFNEAAFTAPIGEIITVDSQFGTHLIKVIDKSENSKKVKVAVLTRNVEPGKNTVQEEYTKAVKFASQNRDRESFVATAEEQGLNKRIASKVRPMDQKIAGIEKPRPLIQWAYESDEGAVSDIFEFTDKYVVASIAKKREEGDQPLEDVEAQVRLRVKKLKKAEYIKNNFNFDNLENTAAEFNTTIETASNINFNSYSVPGAGAEPAVIATAVNMEEGNTSGPVTGEKGVYVIKVTGEDMPEVTEAKVEMQQMRLDRSYQSRANYEPLNVLKKEADIVDNRVDFY
jgi:peptidyl-prolyl cis-trans isomerase D